MSPTPRVVDEDRNKSVVMPHVWLLFFSAFLLFCFLASGGYCCFTALSDNWILFRGRIAMLLCPWKMRRGPINITELLLYRYSFATPLLRHWSKDSPFSSPSAGKLPCGLGQLWGDIKEVWAVLGGYAEPYISNFVSAPGSSRCGGIGEMRGGILGVYKSYEEVPRLV
ncbi:hypothetical protein F5B17DRAFT_71387 [Nemania serpens]|nr:hypothetical protein F5B17DRAFT_71387 [Nemania serpens]